MKVYTITTYVNEETYKKVAQLAFLDARSVSGVLKLAVQEYLDNNKKILRSPILQEKKAKAGK
jgi:hypothetical protein